MSAGPLHDMARHSPPRRTPSAVEPHPDRGLAAVRDLLREADGLLEVGDEIAAAVIRALRALTAEVERHLLDGHGPEPLSPRIERQ